MANLKLKTQFNDLVDASVIENQIEDLSSSLDDYALKQQMAWLSPTLTNGWANQGSVSPMNYMKDEFGFVHLRGIVNGTSKTSNVVFILPLGYRPFKVVGTATGDLWTQNVCFLQIEPDGSVLFPNSNNTYASIHVSFKVD